MAFRNPLSYSSVKNSPKRNGFDRSHTVKFSSSPGMLLPLFWEEILPGDTAQINMGSLTRTLPLATANFGRVEEHIDVFAVNIDDLWHYFNDFIAQNPQVTQVAKLNPIDVKTPKYQPVVTLANLGYLIQTLTSDRFANRTDDGGVKLSESTIRLLDMLGYGDIEHLPEYQDLQNLNTPVSLFPLLAYQKIYYDFYRNTDWEANNPLAYNVDYLAASADSPLANSLSGTQMEAIDFAPFQMRYANYKKDYFMGLKPSTQFGDVSVVSVSSDAADLFDTETGNVIVSGRSLITNAGDTRDNVGIASASGSGLGIKLLGEYSILAQRKAEAMQRWQEVTGANKHNYPAQTKAHFDENVPNVIAGLATWLGGHVNQINISEVLSTAETGDASLGQIGGRAVGVSSQNHIKFTNKDNVRYILMGIYHIKPQLDYPSIGLNPQLFRAEAFDYFTPEFQNIGLAPIYANRLAIGKNQTIDNATKVLGYAARYLDYKVSRDEVHGQLRSDGINREWAIPLADEIVQQMAFSDEMPNYLWQKVKPSCLNNMFLLASDGTQVRDNFLNYFDLNIRFVRKMSVDGMPY